MKNSKSMVQLREKKLESGSISLYLDIYNEGIRTYQFLKMYLSPGNDPLTKARNKSTLIAAKTIQAQKLVEIQSGKAGISPPRMNVSFVDYYQQCFDSKEDSEYRTEANCVLLRWIAYAGSNVLLSDINAKMLEGFVKYLRNVHGYPRTRKVKLLDGRTITAQEAEVIVMEMRYVLDLTYKEIERRTGISQGTCACLVANSGKRTGKPLSEITVATYFTKVAGVIRKAHDKGLIPTNPIKDMDKNSKPKSNESEREFLTVEELRKLAKIPARNETVKRMFMFACFTGLRISDIKNLTWKKIDDTRVQGTMQKTDRPVYIPLSNNARKWLPSRGNADDRVFVGYPGKVTMGKIIDQWCKSAGIEKHITFHCSRHTFATLSLENGADLYTISNLLGHTKVTTTAIYAKIVDTKKKEAVDKIPEI